jgi:hypothetical protein
LNTNNYATQQYVANAIADIQISDYSDSNVQVYLTNNNYATEQYVANAINDIVVVESIIIAASDETTALTVGTNKVSFRMPYAFTLTDVRASLNTAQVSGNTFTVDVKTGDTPVSILSTKITIDNTQFSSVTANTAAVISTPALADDERITVDIDQVGNGTAAGLKISLIGYKP